MAIPKERKLQVYATHKHALLVKGYKKVNEVSESKCVSQALKFFFDAMSEADKQRFLNAVK